MQEASNKAAEMSEDARVARAAAERASEEGKTDTADLRKQV